MQSNRTAQDYRKSGDSYHKQSEWDLAINDYTQAIVLDPNDAMIYNNRGIAYSMQGKWDFAIHDYIQAIELNPNYANAYNNRGNSYNRQHKWDLAIHDYIKAIELDPNFAMSYYNRGAAYNNQGKWWDLAIRDYTQAIELDPNHAYAYNKLKIVTDLLSKTELFNIIQTLPVTKQIRLRCLDKDSALGKEFWREENFSERMFGCNLESGVLLAIKQHLSNLTKSMASWIFLLGPEFARNHGLCMDIFFHITSYFLEVDINSVVDKNKSRIEQLHGQNNQKEEELPIQNPVIACNDIRKELDELNHDILNTPCPINRYVFFTKQITLRGYLTNLIESGDDIGVEKAKNIISCLKKSDFENIETHLKITRNWFDPSTETTGIKIWKSLLAGNPDILQTNRENTLKIL